VSRHGASSLCLAGLAPPADLVVARGVVLVASAGGAGDDGVVGFAGGVSEAMAAGVAGGAERDGGGGQGNGREAAGGA